MLEKLNIKRPKGKAVWSVKEGIEEANKLEYPLLVRPSYVLGGQGMEITRNEIDLVRYLTDAFIKDTKNPVLIDRYLGGRELEVDAICDGTDVLIPGIMEHLKEPVYTAVTQFQFIHRRMYLSILLIKSLT